MTGKNLGVAALIVVLALGVVVWIRHYGSLSHEERTLAQRTQENYGRQAREAAALHGVPEAYLLALIALETSGRRPAPSRFERHVYARLKKVQRGQLVSYQGITGRRLRATDDRTLRWMATSWGPFQIMGLNAVKAGIPIMALSGPRGVHWGARWIRLQYGKVLKRKQYRDAFHLHNTGRPFPASGRAQTHDPRYVPRGMRLLRAFSR